MRKFTITTVVLVALVAGCGSSGTTTVTTTVTSSASGGTSSSNGGTITWNTPPSSTPTSCSISYSDVEVQLTSQTVDVTPGCTALQQGWASNGQYWANGGINTTGVTTICTLGSADNNEQVTVTEGPDIVYGLAGSVCASFVSQGWTQQ